MNKLVIYGAGDAGKQLLEIFLERKKIYDHIYLIDDSAPKIGTSLKSIKILSFVQFKEEIQDIDTILLNHFDVFVAIPSLERKKRALIVSKLIETGFRVRSLPGLREIINGTVTGELINSIRPEDVLGRDDVSTVSNGSFEMIQHKTVLITGAAGSIGSQLVEEILKRQPNTLILLDQNEFGLYHILEEINTKYSETDIKSILGSATDKDLLERIFKTYKINLVFHAAAYKHVPLLEENVEIGVANNVLSCKNICELADQYKVEACQLISSDKAVRPTNIMGASKRLCELIFQSFSEHSLATIFSMVRFGNVLDSSGSVVPKFRKQIEAGGPLTVTHKEIVRYFMTIKEACILVLEACSLAKGGEVFLLDMGKEIRILDLARQMIELSGGNWKDPDSFNFIEIEFTGLRPGEKIHEELLIDGEVERTKHKKIFSSKEKFLHKDYLDGEITKLLHECKTGNKIAVISLIKSLIPEFNHLTNSIKI